MTDVPSCPFWPHPHVHDQLGFGALEKEFCRVVQQEVSSKGNAENDKQLRRL